MLVWQILCAIGVLFVILEIFTPSMFFLNFALAAFITAGASLFIVNYFHLVLVFFVFSFISFVLLRPIIMKASKKGTETGVRGKYIGNNAFVTDEVTSSKGAITMYGERWDARSDDGSTIPVGSEITITRNEGIVMYVVKKFN